MAEALKTKEQLEKEWWDAWWAADYSWGGLANKAWVGWVVDAADGSIHEADAEAVKAAPEGRFRKASLQDYWRDQAHDLIKGPGGATFTRVHLPLAWRDGTPTGKGEWADEALDAILAPKLISGAETTGALGYRGGTFNWVVTGVDRRTQLQGAMLLGAVAHPQGPASPVHLQCRKARFLRHADFEQQVFGPGAEFNDTTFSERALFESATFSGSAWFRGAIFSGATRFASTTFAGDARFANATFSGRAWFASAIFSGVAWFESAIFSGDARFANATFSGNASFDCATFSEDARFANASFYGNALFFSVIFSGNAWFSFTTFHKDAWFTASGDAEARKPATFMAMADFDSAVFKAPARFREARFAGRMDFDKGLFGAIADFSKIETPNRETFWRGAFDGVLFERALDLRGIDPKAVSMIAGATLDRDVLLDRTDERAEAKAHRLALGLACDAEDREDALKALESGALKLKQAMHAASDIAREQRFYRLELRARRKQKGTSGTEKLFSLLYAGASKYGASIGWPFLWLGGVIVGFAAMYLAIEGQLKPPESRSVFESLRYSLSRVIPLGTWDESDDPLRVKLADAVPAAGQGDAESTTFIPSDCSFRERLMAMDGCRPDLQGASLEAYRLILSALATFQTVIAAALYFLLALAVRRKFQIS